MDLDQIQGKTYDLLDQACKKKKTNENPVKPNTHGFLHSYKNDNANKRLK